MGKAVPGFFDLSKKDAANGVGGKLGNHSDPHARGNSLSSLKWRIPEGI
jgi:hypothetical protein